MSVVLVWLMYGMTKRRVFAVPFILGALALFLTFSQVAWAAFVFGILALFLIERFGKGGVLASLAATATIVFFGIGHLVNFLASKNYYLYLRVYSYFANISLLIQFLAFYFVILLNRISFYAITLEKNFKK